MDSTFAVSTDLDQDPSVNIRARSDISAESEYINTAFMTNYSHSVRFTMSKFNNPFVKISKKCKICEFCNSINPKQLNLCFNLECGRPLVNPGRGND